MRKIVPALFALASVTAAADFQSAKQISETSNKLIGKGEPFASAELGRYKGHYTLLAVRNHTGSAEVHENEADYFVVEKGGGILITGGKVINPKTQKAGEIRGTSIQGGERHTIGLGDVVHIPAGEPHQLLIKDGEPISYFVIKVSGQ